MSNLPFAQWHEEDWNDAQIELAKEESERYESWRSRGPALKAGETVIYPRPVIVIHLATKGTETWTYPLTACSGTRFQPDDGKLHVTTPRMACPLCTHAMNGVKK